MKSLLFLVILGASIGCSYKYEKSDTDQSAPVSVGVDSLNALFLSGWNKKDSALIMSTLAPDAVVMNDSLIHTGTEAIAKNWVSGGVKVLSNIITTSSIDGTSGSLAYDAGTYTLDLTIPGGPVLKERGNYSLVWTRQVDQQWLLTMVHIEDVTRMPDIR
jgi:ketosteroid isomerase-like protein